MESMIEKEITVKKLYLARLPNETIEAVKSFYLYDDTSWQAPGIKDVVTLCNGEGETTKETYDHVFYGSLQVLS